MPSPLIEIPPSPTNSHSSTSSYTSSFEADDELSSSPDSEMDRPPNTNRRFEPQYPGEDTRLTSKKELRGWYAYSFAAEVFVICGVGSFIPITLEQLSRENGVLLSDRMTPCVQVKVATNIVSRIANVLVRDKHAGQCVIYFLGMEINTASFALYAFSISVFIQAIVVISISCAADHGKYRKNLLLAFAFAGAIACMAFIIVVPRIYLLGALLAIVSNTCFGASFVLLNSFLPLLVRHHPSTQAEDDDEDEDEEEDLADPRFTIMSPSSSRRGSRSESAKLMSKSHASIASVAAETKIATTISSTGIGIGYSGALFLQCLSIGMILALGSSTFSLRLVLFVVGLWWFVFTLPAALWLRSRPGPPLPVDSKTGKARTWIGYTIHSWSSLYKTARNALLLKDISLFLLAWFLISDAIATVSSTAILFAKTQLQMSPPYLALISVTTTTAGILGAFTWSFVARRLDMKPVHTILACLALFELVPIYGLLAYVPAVQRLGYIGLQQPWEMYPIGFVYGLVLGGFSSYCRALFGELIPPGSEAAFYALYAITDKGSSVFGPTIVGLIIDHTGEIRAAFWFLAVLVGLPAPIIYFVNVERGKREGRSVAKALEGAMPEDNSARAGQPSL